MLCAGDLSGTNELFVCRVLAEFYEHFLDDLRLYSLYAAVAAKCRYFKDCINALTRCQLLCRRRKNTAKLSEFKQLAVRIFTKHDPINQYDQVQAPKNINDKDFALNNICMASATYIESNTPSDAFTICSVCKFKTLKSFECDGCCPLCHSPIG